MGPGGTTTSEFVICRSSGCRPLAGACTSCTCGAAPWRPRARWATMSKDAVYGSIGSRSRSETSNSLAFHKAPAPLRHRVVTGSAPRVTSQQPAQSQPASSSSAVPLDRLRGVRGTTRLESARRRQQRRDSSLVPADQQDEDVCEHRRWTHETSSSWSWRKRASYASRRARTSTSALRPARSSPGRTCRRSISRSRRFTRLRSTALLP